MKMPDSLNEVISQFISQTDAEGLRSILDEIDGGHLTVDVVNNWVADFRKHLQNFDGLVRRVLERDKGAGSAFKVILDSEPYKDIELYAHLDSSVPLHSLNTEKKALILVLLSTREMAIEVKNLFEHPIVQGLRTKDF